MTIQKTYSIWLYSLSSFLTVRKKSIFWKWRFDIVINDVSTAQLLKIRCASIDFNRYHNSKNCPVCCLCIGISFTCDVRLCTVNIPQPLTNTNSRDYHTVLYGTGTFWLNIDEIKGTVRYCMARNRTWKKVFGKCNKNKSS